MTGSRFSPIAIAIAIGVLCGIPLAGAETAGPLLHPLLGDGAVLQRGKAIPLWGWSVPGRTVHVSLERDGRQMVQAAAEAGADGRWQVQVGPLDAGGPWSLQVGDGVAEARSGDLLTGDVWLCGGQSNMEWSMKNTVGFAAEAAQADRPAIRLFKVERHNAGHPQSLCRGRWDRSTPATVGEFSAVAYAFARSLQPAIGVPVGLVSSNWGGTTAEAWTSARTLAAMPGFAPRVAAFQDLVRRVEEQTGRTGQGYAALLEDWFARHDPGSAPSSSWAAPGQDDAGWQAVRLPGPVTVIDPAFRGTVWLRCRFQADPALAGSAVDLCLGRQRASETVFVNGRPVAAAHHPWLTWRTRRIALPAGTLQAGENVIAIRLLELDGRAALEAPSAEELCLRAAGGRIQVLPTTWQVRAGAAVGEAGPLPLRYDHAQLATSLHQGMIAPLQPMGLSGVIWYQGESNARRAGEYGTLLPALIADWRSGFGQGDLPFLIVQLANFRQPPAVPGESDWAVVREAQARTASRVPKAGLAVAIDLGEADDIHPRDKREVGRRLALAAEAVAYGRTLVHSGPWYRDHRIDGAAIRLSFDQVGSGLAARGGGPLTGFAIAGEDRVFTWAEARIDGDAVVVHADAVPKPVAVRYAWADNPHCNLVNREGLPAVPFRTDAWPPAAGVPAAGR